MSVPDWISTWDDEFQPAFWMATHAMTRTADTAFRRHGVRQGQQYILMCLWHEDGQSPGDIATTTGLATPTVTRSATRMEAAGLLRRAPHPTDRRLVCLRLTGKGKQLRRVLNEEISGLSDRALAGLSAAERASLTAMLHKVRSNLTAG